MNHESKKSQIIDSANDLVATNYNNTLNSFETLANTVYNGYINKKVVRDLFELRNRKTLYYYLQDDYKYLASIDFKQIHFHLPTNHSFLRMHKPNRFGDDLTDIRYSVKYVNENKTPITGLEMGRVVPGFRFVYPMKDGNNNHIGSVETSFSVKAFLNKLESVYDVHGNFLLDKEIYERKIFDTYRGYYEPSIELDNYITLKRENKAHKVDYKEFIQNLFRTKYAPLIQDKLQSQKTFGFALEIEHNGKHYYQIASFIPLQNIQNEHLGYFVIYQNNDSLLVSDQQLYIMYIIFTVLNLFFIYILYREVTRKERLSEIVEGKTKELVHKTQELEDLNDSLEDRINEEVDKSKRQEQQLYEIEKMAQMGEMIGNIAHQWRQPLSAIATAASSIKMQKELNVLDDEFLKRYMDGIIKNTEFLSETIDTFRDFIRTEKNMEKVYIEDVVKTVLDITKATFKNNYIEIIDEIDYSSKTEISTISKELSQVIINILNNAKDIIQEREVKNPQVKINIFRSQNEVIIAIADNAGGVPKEVLPKIFDPYFTTKHQSMGTGLGLHMSKKLVHDSLKGQLNVKNIGDGAVFFITLPLH